MVDTLERRQITTSEDGQYWGAFFGNALYLNINRCKRGDRTYYAPDIFIQDTRRAYLNHIQNSFGGLIPPAGDSWGINNVTEGMVFARTISPHVISQHYTLHSELEFMEAKQERLRIIPRVSVEDREVEEAELYDRFVNVKYATVPERRIDLTPPTLAGLADSRGYIQILRKNRLVNTYPSYVLILIISSDDPSIIKSLESQQGESVELDCYEEEDLAEQLSGKPYWRAEGAQAFQTLSIMRPYARLLRPQVDLGLAFYNTQNALRGTEYKGVSRTSVRRSGYLANVLSQNTTNEVDLITVLRQGFYSSMHELNDSMSNIS